MQFLSTNNKTVKRRTHIFLQKNIHRTSQYLLIPISDPRQSKTSRLRSISIFLPLLFSLKQLLYTLLDGHKFGWLVYFLVFKYIFLSPLFDFDIYKNKSMQPWHPILLDFIIPTVRSPFLSPQRHWNYLTKSINLQSATSNCTDNASIVHNLHLYLQLSSPHEQIWMRGRTESISNH